MKVYGYGHGLFTRGVPLPAHVDGLVREGWSVLSLTPRRPPHLAALGERSIHLPLVDSALTATRIVDVLSAADVAVQLASVGPCLVHCAAGRNRSVFVVALALTRITGRSGVEALEHVRRVRPGCLSNPDFVDYLLRISARNASPE